MKNNMMIMVAVIANLITYTSAVFIFEKDTLNECDANKTQFQYYKDKRCDEIDNELTKAFN